MRLTLGDEPVSNEFPNLSNIMLRSAGSRKPCTRKEIFGLWSYPKRKLGDKGKCHLYKTTSFTLKMMKSSSNEKIYLHVLSLLRPKGFNKENSKEDIIRVISSPLLSYWKHNLLCANQGKTTFIIRSFRYILLMGEQVNYRTAVSCVLGLNFKLNLWK